MKYQGIALLTILTLSLYTLPVHAESKSVTVNISATILPIFELNVSGPTGGSIEFGGIRKNALEMVTADSQEVVVAAHSNLNKPYTITQQLVRPMQNADGIALPSDALTVSARSELSQGRSSQNEPVTTSVSTLFQSDAQGKSDVIHAVYQLKVAPAQEAGHYQSKLIYSIVTK